MGKKIQEIRLGMREAREQDAEELETLIAQTMPTELDELFYLTLGVFDLNRRVSKEINGNPKRFSRWFSLEHITREPSIVGSVYFVTVSLCVEKNRKSGDYAAPNFQIMLQLRQDSGKEIIVCGVGAHFAMSPKEQVKRLLEQAMIRTEQKEENASLVLAYILQGVQKAYSSIMADVRATIKEKVRKWGGPDLFNICYHQAIAAKSQRGLVDSLSVKLDNARGRVLRLEGAMKEAVEGIVGTKGITKSPVLQGIRERLEAALNEGEPGDEG